MVTKQKILIVDDDENIAELISLYLTKECFDTMIVHDGEEALTAFESYQPNLMLLDLMLPGIDGYQVCREIRSKHNTPIIMLSAKGEVFDKVRGLELGADDYILKPFDSKELVARVKAVLRRYQPAKPETPAASRGKVVDYPGIEINLTNYAVTVDGKNVDTASPVELEYGLHQMTVTADGYDTVAQYIKVAEPSASISVELEKSEESTEQEETKEQTQASSAQSSSAEQPETQSSATQSTASQTAYKVHIDSPVGAEVYLDGNYIGIAPVDFEKKAGNYVVSLRKTGYQTRSYTLQVAQPTQTAAAATTTTTTETLDPLPPLNPSKMPDWFDARTPVESMTNARLVAEYNALVPYMEEHDLSFEGPLVRKEELLSEMNIRLTRYDYYEDYKDAFGEEAAAGIKNDPAYQRAAASDITPLREFMG